MKKLYELTYTQLSGGIKQVVKEYWRSEKALYVALAKASEICGEPLELDDAYRFINAYDENDIVTVPDIWYDGIINGGDWIYSDMFVCFIHEDDQLVKIVNLTANQVGNMTDVALGDYVRNNVIFPHIYDAPEFVVKLKSQE